MNVRTVFMATSVISTLAVVFISFFWPPILWLFVVIVPLVIFHNSCALLLGFAAGLILQARVASRKALLLEIGIQNSGLGIVILLTQLGGLGGAGAVAGLWGTWHIISGLFLVALFHWSDRHDV